MARRQMMQAPQLGSLRVSTSKADIVNVNVIAPQLREQR